MSIVLLVKFWREVLIFVLAGMLCLAAVFYDKQAGKIAQLKTSYQLEVTSQRAEYEARARQIESHNYEQTIKAVNEAKAREQVIIADAANARDDVTRLSNTIDKLADNAKADASFRDRYLTTSNQLFKECIGEYSKMGEIADRLGSDLRLSQQANKR